MTLLLSYITRGPPPTSRGPTVETVLVWPPNAARIAAALVVLLFLFMAAWTAFKESGSGGS